MSDDTVPCIGKVPDYEIRDGIMYITSGDWSCCMPLRVFKLGRAKSDRVIAEYEGRRAEVARIPLHSV
jgi:hypothetical protein